MRNALITGGSSGIGRAVALQLAGKNSQIFITGRSEKRLHQVCKEIEGKGGICYYESGDVRYPKFVKNLVKTAIEKMGNISVFIANAGVGRFKNLEDFTDDEFDIQFDTNVKGVFLFLRPILKHMKENKKGQIIVTSSNLGLRTSARCGIYAATKHAVQAMVGSLRDELKGTGVKAATVNPGSGNTPWFDGRDVDRSKMIDVNEVAEAFMMIINQGNKSDIAHLLIEPAKRT